MAAWEDFMGEGENTFARHQVFHAEVNRRLDVLNNRGRRHREDIESARREVSDIQGRLRKVEDELMESQVKVSWSGGSCWIPANCPTST